MSYNGATPEVGIPVVSPTFRDLTVTGTFTGPFPAPSASIAGSVTLISDPQLVLTPAIQANSLVFVTYGNNPTPPGAPTPDSVYAFDFVPGVSFQIGTAAGVLAIGAVVNWLIINP